MNYVFKKLCTKCAELFLSLCGNSYIFFRNKSIPGFKGIEYFKLLCVQKCHSKFPNVGRYAIIRLSNSARYRRNSIAVAANGNGVTDRIFKACGLKERFQRLRAWVDLLYFT